METAKEKTSDMTARNGIKKMQYRNQNRSKRNNNQEKQERRRGSTQERIIEKNSCKRKIKIMKGKEKSKGKGEIEKGRDQRI